MSLRNINAYFGDTAVDAALRHRTERRPAGDAAGAGHQSRAAKMRRVPLFPGWRLGLEGRVARGDTFPIDSSHLLPIGSLHDVDHNLTHSSHYNWLLPSPLGEGWGEGLAGKNLREPFLLSQVRATWRRNE